MCDGNGESGFRIPVLYIRASGVVSRHNQIMEVTPRLLFAGALLCLTDSMTRWPALPASSSLFVNEASPP